jgi:hypothetical protein
MTAGGLATRPSEPYKTRPAASPQTSLRGRPSTSERIRLLALDRMSRSMVSAVCRALRSARTTALLSLPVSKPAMPRMSHWTLMLTLTRPDRSRLPPHVNRGGFPSCSSEVLRGGTVRAACYAATLWAMANNTIVEYGLAPGVVLEANATSPHVVFQLRVESDLPGREPARYNVQPDAARLIWDMFKAKE